MGMELYEIYKQKIFQCDKQIEKHLSTFESVKTEMPKLKKTRKKRNDYVPHFDLKTHLYRITGVDLTKI